MLHVTSPLQSFGLKTSGKLLFSSSFFGELQGQDRSNRPKFPGTVMRHFSPAPAPKMQSSSLQNSSSSAKQQQQKKGSRSISLSGLALDQSQGHLFLPITIPFIHQTQKRMQQERLKQDTDKETFRSCSQPHQLDELQGIDTAASTPNHLRRSESTAAPPTNGKDSLQCFKQDSYADTPAALLLKDQFSTDGNGECWEEDSRPFVLHTPQDITRQAAPANKKKKTCFCSCSYSQAKIGVRNLQPLMLLLPCGLFIVRCFLLSVLLCVRTENLCISVFRSFCRLWTSPQCRHSRQMGKTRLSRRQRSTNTGAALPTPVPAAPTLSAALEETVLHHCTPFHLGVSANCSFAAVAACTCASSLTPPAGELHVDAEKQQQQQKHREAQQQKQRRIR